MLTAAMLLAPGCGDGASGKAAGREEAVRRAAFRSLVARDFLASCPGGARPEGIRQTGRYAQLKQRALRRGAGHAIWLGENDFGAIRPQSNPERCEPGEDAYREALAQSIGALDELTGRIAAFEE
jgi:hypothetical protein